MRQRAHEIVRERGGQILPESASLPALGPMLLRTSPKMDHQDVADVATRDRWPSPIDPQWSSTSLCSRVRIALCANTRGETLEQQQRD